MIRYSFAWDELLRIRPYCAGVRVIVFEERPSYGDGSGIEGLMPRVVAVCTVTVDVVIASSFWRHMLGFLGSAQVATPGRSE
jgi:hypothetical protein